MIINFTLLQNVGILLEADRCSLFLMHEKDGEKSLVSSLFDVHKVMSGIALVQILLQIAFALNIHSAADKLAQIMS